MSKPALLAASLTIAFAAAPAPAQAQSGPVERVDPRLYDVGLEITVVSDNIYDYLVPLDRQAGSHPDTQRQPAVNAVAWGSNFTLANARIAMPFIETGAFSRADVNSVHGELQMGNRTPIALGGRFEREAGQPFATSAAVIPIEGFSGQVMRFSIEYRVEAWSSQVDEVAVSRIPWPTQWPEEVQDGLRAEPLIESDDAVFKALVERISEGRLRMVTPYVAAKEIARWSAENVPSISRGQLRGGNSTLVGIDVVGARATLGFERGTPFDLVCVSVALLRAAGIPARPVTGISNVDSRGTRLGRNEFVAWAEFYLPEVGWIPFDPDEMQGKGLSTRRIDEPFAGFANMRRLNRRVPMAYSFLPHGYNAPQAPSLWGWQAASTEGTPAQMVQLKFVSRGTSQSN